MVKRKKVPTTRWHNGTTPVEELAEDEQIAHQLVSDFADLAPSVERIMDSDLEAPGRVHALTAFQASLGQLGDPNRDPRVAIENARGAA